MAGRAIRGIEVRPAGDDIHIVGRQHDAVRPGGSAAKGEEGGPREGRPQSAYQKELFQSPAW